VESLIEVPAGWTAEEASGAALVYVTAYQALTQWEDIPGDAVVLISGASGGVGIAAFELAAAMGFKAIGLSRDGEKRKRLESLGLALALDPADSGWRSALGTFLGKRKVDLAVDSVGGALFPELIATLGNRGRVSVVGRLAGDTPRFNTATLLFRRIRIGGVAVGAYTAAESRTVWTRIVELLNRTGARPLVDAVFDFEDLPGAFARLAAGPMGKVLVRAPRA
jgi:NADPH2:quinone reductase